MNGRLVEGVRRIRRRVVVPAVSVGTPGRRELAERTYAWWWWRSLNRPRTSDETYRALLAAVPEGAVGLDLGSRNRIRDDALTVDVVDAEGVDLVADGHLLPFVDASFDYVWCNAVLEHVRNPFQVASEIVRILRPGGLAVVQVPFLESVHGWPDDYFRFTPNGLRQLFADLEEIAVGTSAGPGQVLPDLLEHYAAGFSNISGGSLFVNLWMVVVGTVLWPLRRLDDFLRHRPTFWKWARAYYYVGRKPLLAAAAERERPVAAYIAPTSRGTGFEEVMVLRAGEHVRALARSGIDPVVVDVDSLERSGTAAVRGALDLRPDLVLAPNLNYYLAAVADLQALQGGGARPVLLWDDPLGALALWLQGRRAVEMGSLGAASELDALGEFRRVMRVPGVRHFAWDSGHADVVAELGLADGNSITWYPIATYEAFLERGRRSAQPVRDVAFCGNVYPRLVEESAFARVEPWASLSRELTAAKARDLTLPVWGLLDGARTGAGLPDLQDARFWDYYVFLVWLAANTHVRLELLAAIERPVEIFGVFGDPGSVERLGARANLVFRGNAAQFTELPDVFATTAVNICPSNTLIHSGVPSKFVDCIASGGFALVDPKPDLVRLFGPGVETVFFRNGDELAEKVEYYLARPSERQEIVESLRATVVRECTLDALFERVRASSLAPGRAPSS